MSASTLRQRGSVAAVLAVALLASACGSSSSSGTAAAASTTSAAAAAATSGGTAAATSAAPPAAGSTSNAPVAAATSGALLTIAPQTAAVTSVKATGGGDFCKSLAAAINHAAVSSTGTTPADLKASIQKSLAVGVQALSKAPSDIKPEVTILLDASAKFYAALAKVNYDFTKISPADEAAFSTPEVEAASTKVDDYVKADCGIDLGGGAAASSS